VIRFIDSEKAEAVLTIRMLIPGVIERGDQQYHLTRTPPQFNYVVESETISPDGCNTKSVTTSSDEQVDVIMSIHADGRTSDGRGFGFRMSVSTEELPDNMVSVHLSMSWTDRDGKRGSLKEELVVPWLGASRKELSDGRWIAGEITPVGETAYRV